MHISHKHKFVYIGIPRTGSRSMFQYRRLDCGRPEGSNMSMRLTGASRPPEDDRPRCPGK